MSRDIKPSKRKELEISSINNMYLQKSQLRVELLGRGFAWLDTGTHENLLKASTFVETIEKRQGYKIGCLEEISLNNKWITKESIKNNLKNLPNNSYFDYVRSIINKA